MKRMNLQSLLMVATLVVFTLCMATNVKAETPQKAVVKTGVMTGNKMDAPKKALTKSKDVNVNETPNMTTKNSQVSGSGDDASATGGKKKLIDIYDKPNPMSSTVKTNSGKALGIESGTKGQGGEPVNPEKMMQMKK